MPAGFCRGGAQKTMALPAIARVRPQLTSHGGSENEGGPTREGSGSASWPWFAGGRSRVGRAGPNPPGVAAVPKAARVYRAPVLVARSWVQAECGVRDTRGSAGPGGPPGSYPFIAPGPGCG